jgi:hypothetical protein
MKMVTRMFQAFVLFTICTITASSQQFPAPVALGLLGRQDPGALAELAANLQTCGVHNWNDLKASGTLTYASGDDHPATLYLLGANYSRLDVETPGVVRSIRFTPTSARSSDERSGVSQLTPSAFAAGLFALARTWTSLGASTNSFSLYDQGLSNVAGPPLHRVTLEYALGTPSDETTTVTFATDLYFDPTTHLLIYDVDSISYGTTGNSPTIREIYYSNYVTSNGYLVPTTIQETLNDQLQWTLQLSQIESNVNPSITTFSF